MSLTFLFLSYCFISFCASSCNFYLGLRGKEELVLVNIDHVGSVISLVHFSSLFPLYVLSLNRSDLIVRELLNKVSCFSPDQVVVLHKVPWIYLLDMTFRLTLG